MHRPDAANAFQGRYPPLSSAAFSPGIGADVWLLGITSIEVSAIATAIEVIVTVLRYRAAGMSLSRMPIFAWYILVVSVMILTAFPPMILGQCCWRWNAR